MGKFTSLLYAEPSFKSGMARTLDIGAVYDDYNYASSPEEADSLAIASDWYAVGADLLKAIRGYAKSRAVEIKSGRQPRP
jgi:hypothetical protein